MFLTMCFYRLCLDKYKYSDYGIGFNSSFYLQMKVIKNVIIFGAYMSSSMHIDNKNKDILILDEEPTQGLDDNTLKQKLNILVIYTIRKKICFKSTR